VEAIRKEGEKVGRWEKIEDETVRSNGIRNWECGMRNEKE
jgi:hypothetical protein